MATDLERKFSILNDYPNACNDLPSFAFCACPENQPNAFLAFVKCAPRNVKVINVTYALFSTEEPVCHWRVSFCLVDDYGTEMNLPPYGYELFELFRRITRYAPMDCRVFKKEVTTPRIATVIYQVDCVCREEDYDYEESDVDLDVDVSVECTISHSLKCMSIDHN